MRRFLKLNFLNLSKRDQVYGRFRLERLSDRIQGVSFRIHTDNIWGGFKLTNNNLTHCNINFIIFIFRKKEDLKIG